MPTLLQEDFQPFSLYSERCLISGFPHFAQYAPQVTFLSPSIFQRLVETSGLLLFPHLSLTLWGLTYFFKTSITVIIIAYWEEEAIKVGG